MGREIVRWKVEPLGRSRRGLDERLFMAAPALRRLLARGLRRPAGSPLRRALITQLLQAGIAANNRGDYQAMSSALHPPTRYKDGDCEQHCLHLGEVPWNRDRRREDQLATW